MAHVVIRGCSDHRGDQRNEAPMAYTQEDPTGISKSTLLLFYVFWVLIVGYLCHGEAKVGAETGENQPREPLW